MRWALRCFRLWNKRKYWWTSVICKQSDVQHSANIFLMWIRAQTKYLWWVHADWQFIRHIILCRPAEKYAHGHTATSTVTSRQVNQKIVTLNKMIQKRKFVNLCMETSFEPALIRHHTSLRHFIPL
jgi:hypothetical protein